MDNRELTLAGLLADPMTQALMAADKVDLAELTAVWTSLAARLAPANAATRPPGPARAQSVQLACGDLPW